MPDNNTMRLCYSLSIFLLVLLNSPLVQAEQNCAIGENITTTEDTEDFLSNTFNLTLHDYPKCFKKLANPNLLRVSMKNSFLNGEVVKICQCKGPSITVKT